MRISIIILTTLILQACNPDGIGCFKAAGDEMTTTISVPVFNEIDLSANIDVTLVSGAGSGLMVTAGSNELAGIRTEVLDGILYLDNLNTCEWSRRYKNPVVVVGYDSLTAITLRGSGLISSEEVIRLESLSLISIEGSGDFRLSVEVTNLKLSSNQIANYYLDGSATSLSTGSYFSDGILYGEELEVVNCYVTHRGTNSMHVNVSGSLTGRIDSFGDVELYGQAPQNIDVQLNSTGQIINNY